MAGYLTHFGLTEAKTPFIGASPRYTDEQFSQFLESIKVHGVEDPILVDDEGNILDGHTRQKAEPDCPFRIVNGLESDDHKFAFAYRKNHERLHQTPNQIKKHLQLIKPVVLRLLCKHSQREVSEMVGVAQSTISEWNTEAGRPGKDQRTKLSVAQVEDIKRRAAAGETQQAIADAFGVTKQRISKILSTNIAADNGCHGIKKTDPISSRALAARSAVASGESASNASGRLGFESCRQYREAAKVAESQHGDLITAMDEGVLCISTAAKLVGLEGDEVEEAIQKARKNHSLAKQKERGCLGKSKPDLLLSAIHNAYMLLSIYGNDGVDAGDIPRSEKKRKELAHLVASLEKVTSVLFSDIRRRLG